MRAVVGGDSLGRLWLGVRARYRGEGKEESKMVVLGTWGEGRREAQLCIFGPRTEGGEGKSTLITPLPHAPSLLPSPPSFPPSLLSLPLFLPS